MGSAFDLGFQQSMEKKAQQRQIAEQQRVQNQNAVGAQLLDAINNASNIKPQTKDENGNIIHNPEYDNAQTAKQKLLEQYTTLMSPAQHASFADHLHGLIFGHADHRPQQPALSPNSSPNDPVPAPDQGQAPAPSSASPAPLHPMAPAPPDHPIHAITKGIKELGNHLSAFAHPLPQTPAPDTNLIAKYYKDPAEVAHERQMEMWGLKGENALKVAEVRGKYMAEGRRPAFLAQSTIPHLQALRRIDPEIEVYGPSGNILSDSQIAEIPEGMIAREFQKGPYHFYAIGDQNAKEIKVGNEAFSVLPLGGIDANAPTTKPLGVVNPGSKSVVTDPFGLKTETDRVVPTPGMNAAPPAPTPGPVLNQRLVSPTPPAPLAAVNANIAAANASSPKLNKGKPVSANAPLPPLDENGHIPAGVGNDLIRQAANGILDGRDPKEFGNPRVQTAALALVDKFVPGYSRGAFTPKEKVQFGVAMHFLDQLKNSDSLSVLDNVVSREKIARAMKAPEHMGLLDRIAAYSLTPKEAEFVRFFNQARGTVAGLSQITRSGRATNSQVNTIAQELPNVFQSSSSDDARKRVDQLLKEADLALHTNPRDVGKQPVSKNVPKSPGGQTLADRLNEALGK